MGFASAQPIARCLRQPRRHQQAGADVRSTRSMSCQRSTGLFKSRFQVVTGTGSRLHRPRRAGVARVERTRSADVQPVPPHAAEGQIGDGLRHMDLADELTIGTVAANAIFLRVCPTHGTPDIPVGVATHPVREARSEVLGEYLAVRYLP